MGEMPDTVSSSTRTQVESVEPTEHLPLSFLQSDVFPPAPTRSRATIDWLPDFSGRSWVAYGASSVLVICHLPSPLSREEITIGPVFRQVLEFSLPVAAVSWSPITPSVGELAVASENCVVLLVYDFSRSNGSFRWIENILLEHAGRVEAVAWSESGDGIVVGGIDVVLWKRRENKIWEIAWKFGVPVPQTSVSATWFIEGFAASAASCCGLDECSTADKSSINVAMVYYAVGNNQYGKTELKHPQPVSSVQWRPSSGKRIRDYSSHSSKQVLLTCCLDGTVRLWCEMENTRARKAGKETPDEMDMSRTFCLGSIIEINKELMGNIGENIFVSWVTDSCGAYTIDEGDTRFYHPDRRSHDTVGQCEWIVGFGTGMSATFWAVHCFDDWPSSRFPRITLWKRQDLNHFQELSNVLELKGIVLLRVVTLRKGLSSPPDICSFIHLLPCDSLVWSIIYAKKSNDFEPNYLIKSSTDVPLLCKSVIPFKGHTDKVIQVSKNPSMQFSNLVASLDSNGLVLLWSLSTFSSYNSECSPVVSAWEVCGRMANDQIPCKYTSLNWTPLLFGEYFGVLLGHVGGIDCFLLNPSHDEKEFSRYLCTIPLGSHKSFVEGPTDICTFPLPSVSCQTCNCDKFLTLGVWMKSFHALSWEVTIMTLNPAESEDCSNFDSKIEASNFFWKFENTIGNKRYVIGVNPYSSELPESYCNNQVTCYAFISPRNVVSTQEGLFSQNNFSLPYIMATGCCTGTVSLWRSNSCMSWELAGQVRAHQDPIHALCVSNCGQRFTTMIQESQVHESTTIQIWNTNVLLGSGTLVLEGTITVSEHVIASSWSALGNGQSILGVCLQNELHVYSQQRGDVQPFTDLGKPFKLSRWTCIAVLPTSNKVSGFLWGPAVNPILVHYNYFSMYGQWLCISDKDSSGKFPSANSDLYGIKTCPTFSATKSISEVHLNELVSETNGGSDVDIIRKLATVQGNFSRSLLAKSQLNASIKSSCIWTLVDIADKLNQTLPVYHPEVLLMNLAAGNWKRANAAVRHLIDFLCSLLSLDKKKNSEMHCHVVPQINLEKYLEGNSVSNSMGMGNQRSADAHLPSSSLFIPFGGNYGAFDDRNGGLPINYELSNLMTSYEEHYGYTPFGIDKFKMFAAVDLLNEIQESSCTYKTLDEPGRRFWVALRYQQLHHCRRFGRAPFINELVVDAQLYCWAFQSDCQDILLTYFLPHESSWDELKCLGVGFWFTNSSQLQARMEKLARFQYLRKKDPKDCTLLYTALKRIPVLASLFKLSKDEKDKPLFGFLSRNFREERNKAAALKNAYVLMGRHQLEMAIAFFLLGGDSYSAITICVKNLGDVQLALVISRLVENNDSSLERHLISKFIVPSATEGENYWLASLLEWQLGNYSCILMHMLRLHICTEAMPVHNVSFTDPSVGLYLMFLTSRNSFKNAIGEQTSAIIGRWAAVLVASSFTSCGFPLEALEFIPSLPRITGPSDKLSVIDWGDIAVLQPLFKQSPLKTSNWISGDVALYLEVQVKVNWTLEYFSKLIKEHPGWCDMSLKSTQPNRTSDLNPVYEVSKTRFREKLFNCLSIVEKKYSADSDSIVNMIFVWLLNNGLQAVGYDLLLDYMFQKDMQNKSNITKLLLKFVRDICRSLSLFTISWSITSYMDCRSFQSNYAPSVVSLHKTILLKLIQALRVAVRIMNRSLNDVSAVTSVLVDLCEYVGRSAIFWYEQNPEGLLFILTPILGSPERNVPYAVDTTGLKDRLANDSEDSTFGSPPTLNECEDGHMKVFKDFERWYVIGICFWLHFCKFFDHKLHTLALEEVFSQDVEVSHAVIPFWRSDFSHWPLTENKETEINILPLMLAKVSKTTLKYILSFYTSQLISFLLWNIVNRLHVATFEWLKESKWMHTEAIHTCVGEIMDRRSESCFDALWNSCSDEKMISNVFSEGKLDWSLLIDHFSKISWTDFYDGISKIHNERNLMPKEENIGYDSSGQLLSSPKGLFSSGRLHFSSQQKIKPLISQFHNTKELLRRDGDLFEALCVNVSNESQVAVSSNKKGLFFFSWETEASWSDTYLPISESSPFPGRVGSIGEKGRIPTIETTLRLSAWPRLDMTGGTTFSIAGYAGTGVSGLSLDVQDNDDSIVTLENLRTRAFSHHPSQPLFLAGSIDTRIYLWEFGNKKPTAIYGARPGVNVSALSAVQFDHCGHRFASAALDGTICTWQLDAWGRSNVCPAESSHCFNDHASDVAYIPSSGSVIASAGYGTNGINVVVWDTLTPPAASQASIICHEGGACSLSVFENVMGTGSVSPIFVTGGKTGDVCIHDLRYMAMGRTRGHTWLDNFGDTSPPTTSDSDMLNNKIRGSQNSNGMLWHIPKAHLGSVTKIRTIPRTTLFLTGSKDGDVKLWDAKSANLVYHWPKLHEKRSFLRPRSRGVGGVVRAAVTDIQVVSGGFLTCGADGIVKYVGLGDYQQNT